MICRRLRFSDLKALGIVNNRVTLDNWIETQDFPPGRMTGPNTRTWDEPSVAEWLATRPIEKKPAPTRKAVGVAA